jgi:hypothetical protein
LINREQIERRGREKNRKTCTTQTFDLRFQACCVIGIVLPFPREPLNKLRRLPGGMKEAGKVRNQKIDRVWIEKCGGVERVD